MSRFPIYVTEAGKVFLTARDGTREVFVELSDNFEAREAVDGGTIICGRHDGYVTRAEDALVLGLLQQVT